VKKRILLIVYSSAIIFACAKSGRGPIRAFPLDSLDGVIARTNVAFDKEISSDGKGSLRIEAPDAVTVPLFEVRDIEIENAVLFYQARVRTEGVIGQVYLEMLVHLPGRGEFFSRGQQTLLSGTNDWSSQETQFLLKKGQKPDYIKLNLVINGHGVAWIDNIKLFKAPIE